MYKIGLRLTPTNQLPKTCRNKTIQNGAQKKLPGLIVNVSKGFISNRITTNVILRLKSYFAVIKEYLSPDISAAGGATVIT
jgi:hypothetical protein